MLLLTDVKTFLIAVGMPVLVILKVITKLFAKLGRNLRIGWKYLLATLVLVGVGGGFAWVYFNILVDLPNVNEIYNPPKLSTKILDRNGVLLYKFYEDENRSWVPLSKVPQTLVYATLAIEDKDYYKHHGLSLKGIATAIFYDFFKREGEEKLRGGSTITQQLVKNVFFSNDNTLRRKIREAILAVMIEKELSKDEILERYFNQVAYGGETYGVQEAAWKYFGKNVWEIDTVEAAFLAGLPAAPSSYSPYGSNPEFAYLRQKHVIEEMVLGGFITSEKGQELAREKVTIVKEEEKILAPHFVFYIKDYLQQRFGYQNFERQGLVVTTSLDINQQLMAERIVSEEVTAVSKLKISNGAALIVDPRNGEILAMVGSRDYYAKDIDGKYNVTTALRQPGSSIKPINYLLALMKGWTLASLVDDSPVVYQIKGQKPYSPQNYNGKYMGKVTLRTALASSLNIPSVKILAQDGVGEMIDLAESMGITTWKERNRFGLALALGSGEVKMTDMATAYSVFADFGKRKDLQPVLEIRNYLGEEIFKKKDESSQIVDPKYAFLINNVLSDNEARSPIFGLNSKLKIDSKTVAVKTGTTNSLKDNWCIGWTNEVLTAVWVGNNDSSPMSWVASGVSGATPIWNRIMREELKNKPATRWEAPMSVYRANICGKEEYFVNGTEKDIRCTPTINQDKESIN
jgi:penicillin-binding protein 1C